MGNNRSIDLVLRSGTGRPFEQYKDFVKDGRYINGLNEYELNISEKISLGESNVFDHQTYTNGNCTQLNFLNLRPGSVVAIKYANAKL